MPWFEVSDGRLRFSGRITRAPFAQWASSPEAAGMVDAAAREIRFAPFGRARTARRRLTRRLHEAVERNGIRTVLANEAGHYLEIWTELAYAPSLPRLRVGLQRLVVVPRTMILARALPGITTRLRECPALGEFGEPFQDFLVRHVLSELDGAIRHASPSWRHPVYACESWACVAMDREFEWIDPMWSGSEWLGHVMMFEMARARMARRQRKELEAAIEELRDGLPGLSHRQRDGVVRTASAGLRPLRI